MLKNDADNNITYNGLNWAYQIKCILDSIGLSYIWNDQFFLDTVPFTLIKQRLIDMYQQTWYASINNSNRLETYARFKHEFCYEKYLDSVTENKYRKALTQFRLSSHDLAIERGRYQNIDRQERICNFCTGKHVESEYHFLLVCPLYRELRQKYMKSYYCRWPTLNKFDSLMSSDNKRTILSLAKYIYYASELRRNSQVSWLSLMFTNSTSKKHGDISS